MKKALCLAPLLGVVSSFAHAQFPPPSSDVTQSVSILQRSPHDRVWQVIKSGTDDNGNPMVWTNTFTELRTGVCRLESNQWVDASEQIETFPEAFVARQGQHQAVFSTNLNIVGATDLLAPDGQRLRSTPVALRYFDRASGKSALIATLKDSQGELADVNQVLYPDAFQGVRAGVRMTYTLAGIEQDILLEQSPPSPEKLGLSSDSTLLQVMTEFYSPPTPEKTERTIQRVGEWPLVDEILSFGAMRTGPSRAFVLPQGENQEDDLIEAVHWEEDSGRFFLVESIEFPLIKPWLDALPPSASLPAPQRADAGSGAGDSILDPVTQEVAVKSLKAVGTATGLVWPPPPPAGHSLAAALLTQAAPRVAQAKFASPKPLPQNQAVKTAFHPVVVLDFTLLSSDTNRTLMSDTTYYVSGPVNLSGTTTIEGGTVVKYANTNSPRIYIGGPVNCQTSPYRPAVFTAKDDDTIGEPMGSGNPPSGYYAEEALHFTSNSELKYIRIAYARQGIHCYLCNGNNTLTHAQFVKCEKAIYQDYSTYYLRNVLLYQNTYALYGPTFTNYSENLTFDQCGYFGYETIPSTSHLTLVNSLLVQITNGCNVYYYSSSYCASSASSAAAFQTVAGAGHYPAIADWRNAGTTSINAGLLADLRKKTTYPPIVWSGDITSDTVLAPQALRDDDPPDLGYHYNPLDWVFHNISLSSAQLTLTNGVAVGVYGTPGINLLSGAKLYSEGAPTNLNRIVRYQTVLEEQPTGWTNSSPPMGLLTVNADYATLPEARFRFTDFSQMTDTPTRQYILDNSWVYPMSALSFTDCQLRGGRLYYLPNGSVNDMRGMTLSFTNNLFHRFDLRLTQGYNNDQTGVGLNLRNNLFYGGAALLADYIGTFSWAIYDNQFDGVDMTSSTVLPGTMNYNGFVNTPVLGGSNYVALASFTYATGVLGDYYQSSTDLINQGTTNANLLGLYHYTTRTTQAKETNSLVDIGLHYVALNGQNLPVDTDADGLPDYFEDRNGDGTTNDTFNWTVARTHTAFPGDLQEYELSWNILVNDPAQDYGNDQNTQSETTLISFGNTVMAAYVDSLLGTAGYGVSDWTGACLDWQPPDYVQFIGWAVSRDAGASYSDKGPTTNSATLPLLTNTVNGVTQILGNAGDPVLGRDISSGTIYLVGIPQRYTQFLVSSNGVTQTNLYVPLWRSVDNGQTFLPPINAAPGLKTTRSQDIADKTTLVVDNWPGQGQGNVYLAFDWQQLFGTRTELFRSSSGGTNWTYCTELPVGSHFVSLAVATNHYLWVAWLTNSDRIYISKSTNQGSNFVTLTNLLLNTTALDLQLKRSNYSSDTNEYFRTGVLPTLAADPVNTNRLYLVYHDKSTTPSDHADIFFSQSSDGGTNWSIPVRVNSDQTTADQWQPAITVKPDGTKLFIGWYDRRADAQTNSLIQTYGVFAGLPVTGVSSFATNFPISSVQYPPVFTGTNGAPGTFDTAYPPADRQDGLCPNFYGLYSHHMGDYDTAVSDNNYVYYCWGDNRNTSTNNAIPVVVRKQADVRFIRISWPR